MSSSHSNSQFDGRRLRILNSLNDLEDPLLGQMYTRCVDRVLSYSPSSQSSRADLSLTSHAIRELINALPDYIGGSYKAPSSCIGHERDALKHLCAVLQNTDEASFKEDEGAGYAIIPTDVASAVKEYRDCMSDGAENAKLRDSLGVLGYPDPDDPSLLSWSNARSFFMKFVHLPRGKAPDLPAQEDVLRHFSNIENTLEVRLGFFFDAKHRIADILNSANKIDDNGAFSRPLADDVMSALSNINDPNLRQAFYTGLKNPNWLEGLDEAKAFDSVPGIDEESSSYRLWPEADYLQRMVHLKPDRISRILLRMKNSENPSFQRSAIDIASDLPEENAGEFARAISQWADDGLSAGSYVWSTASLPKLLCKLLTSTNKSIHSAGRELLKQCFIPREANNGTGCFYGITACVPEFVYDEYLRQAFKPLETKAQYSTCKMFLETGLRLSSYDGKTAHHSEIWIPSVKAACISNRPSVVNSIIHFLSEILEMQAIEDSTSFAKSFGDRVPPFLQRVAMYALTRALSQLHENGEPIPLALKKRVVSVVLFGRLRKGEFDPEYYPLLSESLALGLIPVSKVVQEIESSYAAKKGEYLSLYAEHVPEGESLESFASKRARQWQHRALSLIGEDVLDDEGRRLLSRLSAEFGTSEYTPEHRTSSTITGPNSPIGEEEMAAMDADQLLAHLESWHPSDADSSLLVTHEGQGRVLAKIVTANPMLLQGEADRVNVLRPTYRRAIVEGWDKALSANAGVPVDDLLLVAAAAADVGDRKKFENEGGAFDDDGDYQELRRACANALTSLIESRSELDEQACRKTFACLSQFAQSIEPDMEYERRYGGSNLDPLEMAINTIRPIAIRGIAKWISRFAQDGHAEEALAVLSHHLPNRSESTADAAAIGSALPEILPCTPQWVQENYGALFGDSRPNECQQVVLTTILAYYRPSAPIHSVLIPAMQNALSNDAAHYAIGFGAREGRSCDWLIGDWLYQGYACGYGPDDDPLLVLWRDTAPAKLLGSVLNHICCLLRDTKTARAGAASKVAALWDYHRDNLVETRGAESLRGIESLAESGQYPSKWWGPRMLSEFSTNPSSADILVLGDTLTSLSQDDAGLALDIFACILEHDDNPRGYAYENIAVTVIGNSKRVSKGVLSKKAKDCMNRLGKAGCIDLDEKIDGFQR